MRSEHICTYMTHVPGDTHRQVVLERDLLREELRLIVKGNDDLLPVQNYKLRERIKIAEKALELAKNAFEHNWAIDWNDLDVALAAIRQPLDDVSTPPPSAKQQPLG